MTPETSIYEYAKQGLAQSPEKTALWFYGKGITYRKLFHRIDHAAEQLHSLGVKQGTVVTIRLPNCPQTIIAVYAVAKLGGICNMVHALLPADSLRGNMEFTESSVLITGNHIGDIESITFADNLLYVDISRDMGACSRVGYRLLNRSRCPSYGILFECEVSSLLLDVPAPSSLAEECGVYMHSSGSTGEPKTVMLSHSALNNWIEKTKYYFRNHKVSEQICLSALPYFHALGFQMDMHRVLSCGGTLVLMAKWDGKKAVQFIKKHSVNVMAGVPAMCRSLLHRKDFSGPKIMQLRELYIGGEKLDRSLKRELDARLGAKSRPCVYEGYGLTETASAIAVSETEHYHIDSIGYPVLGVKFLVRQEDGTLYSDGEGELVVGGNCLMMGYLKDPAATESVFFDWNGQRLLRTGDFGRIDSEGLIYFVDRIKNTIIRKGNNVYPGEIEAVIRTVDGVSEVCVIGLPDTVNHTELICACIVTTGSVNESELRKRAEVACKRGLSPISLPCRYIFLRELPKNHMGKIDRNLLVQMII